MRNFNKSFINKLDKFLKEEGIIYKEQGIDLLELQPYKNFYLGFRSGIMASSRSNKINYLNIRLLKEQTTLKKQQLYFSIGISRMENENYEVFRHAQTRVRQYKDVFTDLNSFPIYCPEPAVFNEIKAILDYNNRWK